MWQCDFNVFIWFLAEHDIDFPTWSHLWSQRMMVWNNQGLPSSQSTSLSCAWFLEAGWKPKGVLHLRYVLGSNRQGINWHMWWACMAIELTCDWHRHCVPALHPSTTSSIDIKDAMIMGGAISELMGAMVPMAVAIRKWPQVARTCQGRLPRPILL